ncbi:Acetyltransferase (GNAT) family protein [Pedobacter terrae]|uniref:Acetyltransferase (GNAT) family protein n=1 Tax=Pedobacter terrae TaxID=405671 RepID=A0A1G7XRP7_9SPHI|nr:GNAT family N-acetyltransferase [Pedobacter terrae]SDG86814.1 Acetyltransferase (GNAT) family protein [Pedobacter terrae]
MGDLRLIRTDSEHVDFRMLVALLDLDLVIRDGEDHSFYTQFNQIDSIKEVVIAYQKRLPVACGAIKPFSSTAAEVKRMFVHPDYRNKGIAAKVLHELENRATELGFDACVLETGKRQPEAIALYQKVGYHIISNYGQYIGVDNSVCMTKPLSAKP